MTGQFRNQSWGRRFAELGDKAEGVFEKVTTEPFIRSGLNRPDFTNKLLGQLPSRERHRPDYLTPTGYVEVKGFGREQTARLKVDEIDCLKWWQTLFPVSVFFYDSHKKEHATVPLDEIAQAINDGRALLDHYPEGKAYFAIHKGDLGGVWHKVPAGALVTPT